MSSWDEGLTPEQINSLKDAQMEAIRMEIQKQPIVGEVEPLEQLFEDENPTLLGKMVQCLELFPGLRLRKTRGDGSCFYRSTLLAVSEYYLRSSVVPPSSSAAATSAQRHYERTLVLVDAGLDALCSIGYSRSAVDDFFIELKNYLLWLSSGGITVDTMMEKWRTEEHWGSFVLHSIRCLVALELLTGGIWDFSSAAARVVDDSDNQYFPFILGSSPYESVRMFVEREVEVANSEADQVHVVATARIFSLAYRIIYLDASPGTLVPVDIGETSLDVPLLNLIYRPGHYDIGYPA